MNNLFLHNQRVYDAVMRHYAEGNRKAAVVHATGTGKSYIIGAVAGNYNKVLVIAPNNFVLDETRKVCHDGCEFRTYASVMYNEGDAGVYDMIVLDEFHRSGAEKWGAGVRHLIDANPQALLLGTSATHIRYLDNARNMADEIFDGQVVSYLPLKQAIDERILPNPTYVASLYSFDDIKAMYKRKIANSHNSDEWKKDMSNKINGIANKWQDAHGVHEVIRKYFNHDMQRVIVFCSKVKRAAAARKILSQWFGMAGFNRVRYYNIDYKEKQLEKEMEDFQADMGPYDLKVAISVNMLNEGVHIPRVDGVIMMRSTISRIIIEQQVGRCLTANNSHITPVVIDLVNNMNLISYETFGNFDGDMNGERNVDNNHGEFPFTVIDEVKDIRTFLTEMDAEFTPEAMFARYRVAIDAFYKDNGHLPTWAENQKLYNFMMSLRDETTYRNAPELKQEMIDHLVTMGFDPNFKMLNYDTLKSDIIDFCEKTGVQPFGANGKGFLLKNIITKLRDNHKRKGLTDEQVDEILAIVDSYPTKEYLVFKNTKEFLEENLPKVKWMKQKPENQKERTKCRVLLKYIRLRYWEWPEEYYAELDKIVAINPMLTKAEFAKRRVIDFYNNKGRVPMNVQVKSKRRCDLTPEQIEESCVYMVALKLRKQGDTDVVRMYEEAGYSFNESVDAFVERIRPIIESDSTLKNHPEVIEEIKNKCGHNNQELKDWKRMFSTRSPEYVLRNNNELCRGYIRDMNESKSIISSTKRGKDYRFMLGCIKGTNRVDEDIRHELEYTYNKYRNK